jgi:hypothetical protein
MSKGSKKFGNVLDESLMELELDNSRAGGAGASIEGKCTCSKIPDNSVGRFRSPLEDDEFRLPDAWERGGLYMGEGAAYLEE